MRVGKCVPMIALCLLLCSCGGQEEKKADLRAAYQDMTGCEMTAEVSCDQSGLEWSATLRGTYAPGGESTVEVLEPLDLAGVRAALREDGWTLGGNCSRWSLRLWNAVVEEDFALKTQTLVYTPARVEKALCEFDCVETDRDFSRAGNIFCFRDGVRTELALCS